MRLIVSLGMSMPEVLVFVKHMCVVLVMYVTVVFVMKHHFICTM